MQRYVLLHVANNLTNLFCKKLRERGTSQRHIQNTVRHLQISNYLQKQLTALNRYLYSQKAEKRIKEYTQATEKIYRKVDGLEVSCSFYFLKSVLRKVPLLITWPRGLRRLLQTYLYKFAEMILRLPIQCDMAEISLNRMP